jgi:prepilin-type N-terminal cleavage/methylation domain-containing protein
MRASSRRPAFSILELLVVLAIIGITLGVFIPRFVVSPRSAVETAGMQLIQDLDVARIRALATRSATRVRFTSGSPTYASYLDHDADQLFAYSNEEMAALHGSGERALPKGVAFGRGSLPVLTGDSDELAGGKYIEFSPSGLSASRVAYLRAEDDGNAGIAVQVHRSGGMRLWRYRGGTGWE